MVPNASPTYSFTCMPFSLIVTGPQATNCTIVIWPDTLPEKRNEPVRLKPPGQLASTVGVARGLPPTSIGVLVAAAVEVGALALVVAVCVAVVVVVPG